MAVETMAAEGAAPSNSGVADVATTQPNWDGPPDYQNLEILSPMVRASTLPLRLCSLDYGAGLVYSGCLVDRSVMEAERIENAAFGCIDYVSRSEKRVIWSTCEAERGRNIFQIGTADACSGVQAALRVCRDVRGIDVNMGCTRPFTTTGGMGSVLLEKPEIVADILKTLRRELPRCCALSCKIRMLPSIARTIEFMQVCERSGVDAVAVHLRTSDSEISSGEPAQWNSAALICDAVNIPVIANGDFLSRQHISDFWKLFPGGGATNENDCSIQSRGPAAIMIGRGALRDPSIFRKGLLADVSSHDEVVRDYLRAAVRTNATSENTKWVLCQMMNQPSSTTVWGMGKRQLGRVKQRLEKAMDMQQVCEVFDKVHDPQNFPPCAHTLKFGEVALLQHDELVNSAAKCALATNASLLGG
eukprot:TRINITY_DN51165_c0_g1_i1.p1 TRINITY_DN51165_c0_g1~~TRINITY_DN51165_c0_g1_i1.p1  ORF type:complete len:417 (-),score=64.33 TRINITY_DN51165_c0_g1_i1:66-1316(-)